VQNGFARILWMAARCTQAGRVEAKVLSWGIAHLRNIFEVRAVAVVVASRPGQTSGGRAGDLATLVTSPTDA